MLFDASGVKFTPIPLTDQVRGLYCESQTKLFLLVLIHMAQVWGGGGAKTCSVTSSRDGENVTYYLISMGSNTCRERRSQFKQTFEFSRLYNELCPVKLTNHGIRY